MASNGVYICACVMCVILLVTAGTLIGISFKKLEANEVGLDYSSNSLTIDTSQLYQSGVHFLGVGHDFIRYPRNVQELELKGSGAVSGKTADGLAVTIEARVNYRMADTKEALAALYLQFGGDYGDQYVRTTRSVIRDVCAQFTAFQFWSSRENISSTMLVELDRQLADLHARVDTFLLTNYELPALFEAALVETDVRKQEREKVQFESETAKKETETRVLRSQQDVQIIGLQANATAQSYLLNIEAELVKIRASVAAEVNAYKALKSQLGFSDEELVNYVWLDTLSNVDKSRKIISVKAPKDLVL